MRMLERTRAENSKQGARCLLLKPIHDAMDTDPQHPGWSGSTLTGYDAFIDSGPHERQALEQREGCGSFSTCAAAPGDMLRTFCAYRLMKDWNSYTTCSRQRAATATQTCAQAPITYEHAAVCVTDLNQSDA